MTITQLGLLNTTALSSPGVFVQIVPPTPQINGVPTNNLGLVGTASWGPVNNPQTIGPSQFLPLFGPIINRKYDLGTAAAVATLQGANVLTVVRVTDGTDAAATATITVSSTAAITFTSRYTGSYGNNISVTIATGSAANSYAVTVGIPGLNPEKFNNITGSGATLWANIAAAINGGQSGLRGPSQIIVATAGTATGAPTLATTTLTGGLDGGTPGVGHVTAATLVGADTAGARTGMYALRTQSCSVATLVDADDNTQWTYQAAFALSEGVYMFGVTPSGDTISNAVTTKATAAIDTYGFKLVVGNWALVQDQTNNVQRYVSPATFLAALRAILGPQYSTLNWPLQGIIGMQNDATGVSYTAADIQTLAQNGLDIIAAPSCGGNYFGAQTGQNTSSNNAVNGDNYTSMTNYIATSVEQASGYVIGKPQTTTLRAQFKAALDTFFQNMQTQGQILAWQVICAEPTAPNTNNPQSRISQGYMQADVMVEYLSIVKFLIVNIQGGQTVTITEATSLPQAA